MSVSVADPVPQEDASHSPLISEIPDNGGEGMKEEDARREMKIKGKYFGEYASL